MTVEKKILIIGAGPAGLTAGYELAQHGGMVPFIIEQSESVGGLSRTIEYKGNRTDIGGHRFFSKDEAIIKWWLSFLPLESDAESASLNVMLVRDRISRIFFNKKLIDYPLTLSKATLSNFSLKQIIAIMTSYIAVRLFPIKEERSLKDFFINRFGHELFSMFFKDYTKKLWGFPCEEIKPDWGKRRVGDLSFSKAIRHALKKMFSLSDERLTQPGTETSLIEQFLYPKLGVGQLWEQVARRFVDQGGTIELNQEVIGIHSQKGKISKIDILERRTGRQYSQKADVIISTMPVKALIRLLKGPIPAEVKTIANGLQYRGLIFVGLLVKKLKIKSKNRIKTNVVGISDQWIYVQDRHIRLSRIQIVNNWSPAMVRDANTVYLGLEYFCFQDDDFWNQPDQEIIRQGITDLVQLEFIEPNDILNRIVIKESHAYPIYAGTYEKFHKVCEFTDTIPNLHLIGRNGTHCYDDMEHVWRTAMKAVNEIIQDKNVREEICDGDGTF